MLLLLLFSCKKDPSITIIHGRITEYGAGAPIADAQVYVLCQEGTFLGPSSFSLIDSIPTDADGEFYREYPAKELCGGVSCLPYKKGYFKGIEFYPVTTNKYFDVVLDPEAWLKIVTTPDGLQNYDHIGIGGDIRFETWASQGTKVNIFITRGNREKIVRWGPFSDPSIKFSETLYVPGGDTITYTIHY